MGLTCNSNTWKAEAGDCCEFKDSLTAGQSGMLTPRLGAHPGGLLAQAFGTFLNIKLDACSPKNRKALPSA